MLIDIMIENKKEVLNQAINSKGLMDKHTLKVSQQLDKLIAKRMNEGYRKA